jgi:hypothetical protein
MNTIPSASILFRLLGNIEVHHLLVNCLARTITGIQNSEVVGMKVVKNAVGRIGDSGK